MHKSLKIFGLAGTATALALTPALLAAQDTAPEAAPPDAAPTENADPRLAALTAEQQAAFKAWPKETQDYYRSLTEERQRVFWALADSDKVALSRMPEQQRESTWAQIESRITPPRG